MKYLGRIVNYSFLAATIAPGSLALYYLVRLATFAKTANANTNLAWNNYFASEIGTYAKIAIFFSVFFVLSVPRITSSIRALYIRRISTPALVFLASYATAIALFGSYVLAFAVHNPFVALSYPLIGSFYPNYPQNMSFFDPVFYYLFDVSFLIPLMAAFVSGIKRVGALSSMFLCSLPLFLLFSGIGIFDQKEFAMHFSDATYLYGLGFITNELMFYLTTFAVVVLGALRLRR